MKVLFVQIVIIKQLDYHQVAFSPVRIFLGKMSNMPLDKFSTGWKIWPDTSKCTNFRTGLKFVWHCMNIALFQDSKFNHSLHWLSSGWPVKGTIIWGQRHTSVTVIVFGLLMYLCFMFFLKLITSTIWCGTCNRAGLQFKCVLTDNPPIPGEVVHTTRVFVPYSFRSVVWVLLRPTRTDKWKCCEMWPTVFCPYLRRLESLTICRCHCKGSIFSSVI